MYDVIVIGAGPSEALLQNCLLIAGTLFFFWKE